ncbi:baseplate J/gp47 family protein [Actinoplanes subtropicus]|uniref:baseplate J/gp47 family protein n=1 Tax=Actinoplanes subtropicus TaxID=543632 RepID=UPI0004C3F589|nr:baseplate J/gp47 family protein [Actinoplanes subtropicus]
MTLPPLVLDDLTWETLTEAARRRIPAASGGRWTLHAPVDPGVTVLELLAYLLEQRLYFLDQVPDELVLAILRLLGVDLPRPARPAATVLQPSIEPDGGLLPAGTVLARDAAQQVRFTLDDALAVLPLTDAPVRVVAGGRDRTADLLAGRGVPLLPADGSAAEFRLILPLASGPAEAGLTLLIELDSPAPPSWHPDAVADVPPPAVLEWAWFDPESSWTRPVPEVDDGTAGLRRSGIVRLSGPGAAGLRVSTAAGTFASPPMLVQAVPNAGTARQVESRVAAGPELAAQVGAWLRLPGERLVLPEAAGTLLDAEVTIRRRGEAEPWRAVPGWAFTGPGERVFRIDRAAGAIVFGDGLTGGIPVPDAGDDAVTVAWTRGGGTVGNGGRTTTWVPVGDPVPGSLVSARNVVAAEGGREAETVEQARARAAGDLAEVRRAVTAADFDELARRTPGVAVARCDVAVGAHPAYPGTTVPGAVTVRIVPAVPDTLIADPAVSPAVVPDPGTLAAVRAWLGKARLLGTELFVSAPTYRDVALRADVRGRPADPAAVRATLRLALRRYLDPLTGGDDGAGWPFGSPLRPTALVRVAQAALGDDAEVAAVAVGLDGAAPAEDCTDTGLRPGELPALTTTTLRLVAAPAGPGLS